MKVGRNYHFIIVLSLEILSLLGSPTPIPALAAGREVEESGTSIEGSAQFASSASSLKEANSLDKIDVETPQLGRQSAKELPNFKQSVEEQPELKKPRQLPQFLQQGAVKQFVSDAKFRVKLLDAKAGKGEAAKRSLILRKLGEIWNYVKLTFAHYILAPRIKSGQANYAREQLGKSQVVRDLISKEPERFQKLGLQLDMPNTHRPDVSPLPNELTPAQSSQKLTQSSTKVKEPQLFPKWGLQRDLPNTRSPDVSLSPDGLTPARSSQKSTQSSTERKERQLFPKSDLQLDKLEPRISTLSPGLKDLTPAQLSQKLTESSTKMTELITRLNREIELQGLFELAEHIRKSTGDTKGELVDRFNQWFNDLNLDLDQKGFTIQFLHDEGKDTWRIAEVPDGPPLKSSIEKPSPFDQNLSLKIYRDQQVNGYLADIAKIVKDGEELKFHKLLDPPGDLRPRPAVEDRLEDAKIIKFQRSTKPLEQLVDDMYLLQAEYATYYLTYLLKTGTFGHMTDGDAAIVEETINEWFRQPVTIVKAHWDPRPEEDSLRNIVRHQHAVKSTEEAPTNRQLLARDRLAVKQAQDSLGELEERIWDTTRFYRPRRVTKPSPSPGV